MFKFSYQRSKSKIPYTDIEKNVAESLFDVEVKSSDQSYMDNLSSLFIDSVREIKSKDQIIYAVYVPYTNYATWKSVHQRVVSDLEAKFPGVHILVLAKRKILQRETHKTKIKCQQRPYSRTLKSVHQNYLNDIVYPVPIVGTHTRHKLDGSTILKVYLDSRYQTDAGHKLKTFANAYKALTNNNTVISFNEAYTPQLK